MLTDWAVTCVAGSKSLKGDGVRYILKGLSNKIACEDEILKSALESREHYVTINDLSLLRTYLHLHSDKEFSDDAAARFPEGNVVWVHTGGFRDTYISVFTSRAREEAIESMLDQGLTKDGPLVQVGFSLNFAPPALYGCPPAETFIRSDHRTANMDKFAVGDDPLMSLVRPPT